jgi:protein-disulfide isomerase
MIPPRWPDWSRLGTEGSRALEARLAAKAARCAADQGKFWQYHDLLFDNQESLPRERIGALAGMAGIDRGAFDVCVEREAHRDQIDVDLQHGTALGVDATPTLSAHPAPGREGLR